MYEFVIICHANYAESTQYVQMYSINNNKSFPYKYLQLRKMNT